MDFLVFVCDKTLAHPCTFTNPMKAAFAEKYGSPTGDGQYQISAPWQSALSNGSCVGQMLGLLMTGILADRFGYRKTIASGLILVVSELVLPHFIGVALLTLQRYASYSSPSLRPTFVFFWQERFFAVYLGACSRRSQHHMLQNSVLLLYVLI